MGLDEYESKLGDRSHPTHSALDRSTVTAKSLIYKPQGDAKRYQGEIVVLQVYSISPLNAFYPSMHPLIFAFE